MSVTNRYYTKNGLIQSFCTTYKNGDIQLIEAAAATTADGIDGNPHIVKTPWHVVASIDSLFTVAQHHGQGASEINTIKNTTVGATLDSSMFKLFMKDKSTANAYGLGNVTGKKTLEVFDIDSVAGTIGFDVNMDIADQRSRILNSGLLDQHHYINNYCEKVKSVYPKMRTFHSTSHEVCITLMPPRVSGKARWDRYEKFEIGAWLLWAVDGSHGIKRDTTRYANEWIVSVSDVELEDGKKLRRGCPYKLESQKIVLKPNNNMIVHIKELV